MTPSQTMRQKAARHSLEAHVLAEVAQNLRRQSRSLLVVGQHDVGDELFSIASKLDGRRRRIMKGPSRDSHV